MRNSGRLGLAAWLRELLRDDTFPQQLWWVNKEEQVFALRWTHASCATYNAAIDSVLFHEWAKYTENVKSESDGAKTWKATFRCALASVSSLQRINKDPGQRGSKPPTLVYKFVQKVDVKRKRKTLLPKCSDCAVMETPQLDMYESSGDFDSYLWDEIMRQCQNNSCEFDF